jgi:hypothetical protein
VRALLAATHSGMLVQNDPRVVLSSRGQQRDGRGRTMTNGSETVGIILVHGIGEQRRFDHLDGQTRLLLDALRDHPGVDEVSVDIRNPGPAPFQAEQDTWSSGPEPAVTIMVRWRPAAGAARETRIGVHEVWWADINERYSIAKQFRFWLWGLAIWAHPGKPGSSRPIARRHWLPVVPGSSVVYDRVRLFLSCAFFALLGLALGPVVFIAKRLLDMKTPDVLRVVTNYMSAVKLYVQRRRFGPGLWWSRDEFLDSMGAPPRVSIRRRMVRGIADAACAQYQRWYVLAHSQGTVVAFNGLMADSYQWPGYLDERRWQRLLEQGLAGPAVRGSTPPAPPIEPPPPGWARGAIAYRRRIFQHFRGFLSYGSPLEKFASIWTDLVRISREAVFTGDPPGSISTTRSIRCQGNSRHTRDTRRSAARPRRTSATARARGCCSHTSNTSRAGAASAMRRAPPCTGSSRTAPMVFPVPRAGARATGSPSAALSSGCEPAPPGSCGSLRRRSSP